MRTHTTQALDIDSTMSIYRDIQDDLDNQQQDRYSEFTLEELKDLNLIGL